jgi:hypothetical protein
VTSAIHNRIQLAVEQLQTALALFLEARSYVSALTLAGAAEEILGKALEHEGKQTTLQYEHTVIAPVEKFLRRQPLTWKVFVDEKNRVRNAAKHMRDANETDIEADLEDEALWMIVRACDNYNRLDLPKTDLMYEFENWFYTNVAGVSSDGA